MADGSVVDALLAADSIGQIGLVVRECGLRRAELLLALRRRRDEAASAGRSGEAALIDYVSGEVERILPASVDQAGQLTSFEQLIESAAAAPALLQALAILRRHAHLLPGDPFSAAMRLVMTDRPDLSSAAAPVQVLLGFCYGDAAQRIEARLIWAGLRRNAGDLGHALHHLARALAEIGQDADPYQLGAAKSLQGSLLEELGDLEGAAQAYRVALGLFEESGDRFPRVRYVLAGTMRALGIREGAIAQLDKAIEEARSLPVDSRVLAGQCLMLRGLSREDVGDYDEGAADFGAAAELFAAAGDRPREIRARGNLAWNKLKRGRSSEAVDELTQLTREVDRWGDPGLSAAAHNNLGAALLQNDQPHAAATEYGSAFAQFKPGEMTASGSIALFGLGDAFARIEKTSDGGAAWYHLALIVGLEAGSEADTLRMYLGRSAAPRDNTETRRLLEQALAAAKKSADGAGPVQSGLLETDVLVRLGETDKALERYRSILDDAAARGIEGPDVTRLQVSYARLLRASGASPQDSLNVLSAALRSVAERRARALLDERQAEIVSEAIALYDELIGLLVRHDGRLSLTDDRSPSELAFDLHEEAKSRTFAALLADARLPPPADLPPDLREQEDQLLARERDLQRHLAGGGMLEVPDSLGRLREIRERLAEVRDQMRPIASEYVRLREGHPLRLREAAPMFAAADPGTPVAVASYYCAADVTTCFLALPDGTLRVYHREIGRDHLTDIARRLRATFNGDPTAFPPTRPIAREDPGKRSLNFFTMLSEDLLQFTADVPDGVLVCLIPHGPLHLLPLHALTCATGEPLAVRHPIVYAPSLSALAYILRRRQPETAGTAAFVAGVAAAQDLYPDHFEHDDELFPATWAVSALHGVSASRQAVLGSISGTSIVHLTCHGYFDDRQPMRSGLLFSDGDRRPPGNLTRLSRWERREFVVSATDLAEMSLTARIVTLRACSTGMQGLANRGDEFGGLTRSLLYAGAGSVVAALWNVDQRSSRDLLEVMYRHLAAGEPAWRAIWSAQRAMLSRDDQPYLAHPYHWAPFVLVGDWR